MSYATQAELIERFGESQLKQVADRDGDGVLDDAVITAALEGADAEIDSYVGLRYDLPLASVPPRLNDVALDIAFYKAHPAAVPEDVRQRYEDARKWLMELGKGNAMLDVGGEEPELQGGGQVRVTAQDRVFTRDTLKDF